MTAKRLWPLCCLLGVALCALNTAAELQEISVGGELQIRMSHWTTSFNPRVTPTLAGPEIRIPASRVIRRPIGDAIGGQNVTSHWDWDSRGDDYKLVEQRTVVNFTAKFTDEVSTFIEFEQFHAWGTESRTNYILGTDFSPRRPAGVDLYQAYIEMNDVFQQPLRVRIGRQEMVLGSGWLVGNNSNHPEFLGLSFDGIRATYDTDLFTVDAFRMKLAERSFVERDGDIDFSGIYTTYKGLEDIDLDAYWLWVRDARNIEDSHGFWFNEAAERFLGLDDYGATNMHTVGLRAAGVIGSLDFSAEAAYQFGDAYHVGALFNPLFYGDDDATYSQWAADIELGYRFDTAWQPRLYLGAAYIGGEDNRDITFWEWVNPFHDPEASVSFSRLFSNRVYSPNIDEMSQLSNSWNARIGIDLAPTDRVQLNATLAYFQALETFGLPPIGRVGPFRIPLSGPFTFWTWDSDDSLGWEASLKATYQYSDDLEMEAGWHHFFADDGQTTGNYTDFHGLLFSGGTDDKDADYLYVQTKVAF